ncbi:MAG: PQQ-binding-like beta-propeller repeat protein [Mycobacteriales bacterium]
MRARRLAVAVGLVLSTSLLPAFASAASPRPCAGSLKGGDWPAYGGPVLGQNNQVAEKRISTATVASLGLAWQSAPSGFQAVPVVSGRCVYATDLGHVQAFDIGTGKLVWRTPVALPYTEFAPFAVAVADGVVHVDYDNKLSPRATAFDAQTGRRLWTSESVTFGYRAWQLSSPSVAGNLRFFTTTGPDFDPHARPGFAVMDARTGRVLTKRATIPLADYRKGYSGGGIWGTPVIDPRGLYAYAGTSNPYSKTKEHAYDNAMLKIDVNPKRKTFGQVVASFKGTPDNIVGQPVYDGPVCQTAEAVAPSSSFSSVPCLQNDVDFGNSPTLWRDAHGQLMVSQLQKFGIMFTVRASDMRQVWNSGPIGTDSELTLTGGNHGNAATDGKRLYTMTNPGTLEALDAATGKLVWANALVEPMASKNVALANGVLFASDYAGVHAFDAATGARLWDSLRTGQALNCGNESDMLSMAHGTVLANCGGTIAAFRLPAWPRCVIAAEPDCGVLVMTSRSPAPLASSLLSVTLMCDVSSHR